MGKYIKDDESRRELLDSIGFEWKVREHTHKQQASEEAFDTLCAAIDAYKSIQLEGRGEEDEDEGKMIDIASDFVVPSAAPWVAFLLPSFCSLFPFPSFGLLSFSNLSSLRSFSDLFFLSFLSSFPCAFSILTFSFLPLA